MSDPKTYFVTGGAGFIGSEVVRQLIAEDTCRVVCVDKLTYAGCRASLNSVADGPRFRLAEVDICDRAAIDALIEEEQPDGIFHLAAESHVDRSVLSAGEFMQTNILGTFTLLEAARVYWQQSGKADFRFLHVSTDEVYGSLGDEGLFSEDTAYDPRSPYSASKASSDFLVNAWYHTYGLPVVTSNCSNNYGPYHFPEKLIPLMILNALHDKPLPIYGKGDNVRDWLYVGDHARAIRLIFAKGRLGEKYNVGGRNERSNMDVVHRVCDLLDELKARDDKKSYREQISFVTDRPGHDFRYAIDATKLTTELDWEAQENFETGLRKTVEWYLENEWWWAPLRVDAINHGKAA